MDSRNFRRAAAATVLAWTVAACSDNSPAALVGSAKTYLDKSDYPAAIIELKNALQRAPDDGEARLMLARALLETGDAAAAEAEARKALAAKHPPEQVTPVLARAMVAQGQFRKVVDEFGNVKLTDPAAQAQTQTMLALAYQGLNDTDKALAAADAALAAKPDATQALVAKAGVLVQRRDIDGALAVLDKALAQAPANPEASVMKAELLRLQGKPDEAMATLEASAKANPKDMLTRFAMVGKLVGLGRDDRAAAVVEEMKKIAPKDFRTVYGDALTSFARHDTARARDLVQQLLVAQPQHMPSVYLWGLINLELKQYAVAEEALRRVVARAPSELGAVRALASLYLQTGRAAQAAEILDAALKRAPNDPALLRTAGEAQLQLGSAAKAEQYYERANAVDKGNVASEVRLAQLRLASGDADRGMTDLEALSQAESGTQADMALLSAHLRNKDYDKALEVSSTIEKKKPASAYGPFTRGIVYLAKRDFGEARKGFEKALELQPNFFPAVYNLATLDVLDGKADAARARYEALLAKEPKNEQALLGLAQLIAMAGGSPADLKSALDRAVAANPDSPRPRLALIAHQIGSRDTRAALATAQAAESTPALRNDPQVINALAAAQLAAGETIAATETLKRLVQLSPQDPQPPLELANAYATAKDYDAAIDASRRALALNPELAQPWIGLAKAYIVAGRPSDAIAEAKKLQRDRPDKAFGYLLESEILAQQGKWSQAASAAKEGLARQPTPMLAVRYTMALRNAGHDRDAGAFADRWIKEHPRDAAMHMYLAQQLQDRNDWKGAALHYEAALQGGPDDALLLNNLAWALSQAGDPRAREVAERAYRQAPFNANVIDTLGWVSLQQGDATRATQLLQMAVRLAPADPTMRMHYARALLKTGDRAGAKRELDAVAASDQASLLKSEIDKLRNEL